MEFTAQLRKELGRHATKRVRKEGFVPAVIYGKHMDQALHISINEEIIDDVIHSDAPILKINLEQGDSMEAILKHIEYDPLLDFVRHLDFNAITRGEEIHVSVPIKLVGEPKALELQPGVLEVQLELVNIQCLPKDIPDHFDLDITDLEVGSSYHLSDLKLSDELRLLDDEAATIVTLVRKGRGAAEETVETEGDAEPAEPEVISARKDKEED